MQNLTETKKKDSRRVLKNNIFVFVIFIFFVGVFIFDLRNKNFLNQNEVVGSVKAKIKNGQKKEIVSGAWTDLEVNSKLLNFDTIVTESLSQLEIELKDGTSLTLSENSMIIIDYKDNNINRVVAKLEKS